MSSTYFSSYLKMSKFSSSSIKSIPFSNINEKIECTKEQILENNCKGGKLTNTQIENIHDILKKNINNTKNQLIETENAVFQLSTLEEQKNNIKPNISSIDLGKCETIIKQNTEGLSEDDELIILKTDIIYEDEFNIKSTYVQYEIYNPYTLEEIDLVICDKSEISISVPVYLNQDIEDMNELLNISGYNLFNQNDSFYNDICSKYTTENGTDITLNDRRNYIYKLVNNISLCQEGCSFQFYDSRLKKAKCNCAIQGDQTFISDIKNIEKFFKSNETLLEIFSEVLSFSNFFTLKCYKLLLNIKNIIHNYGCIILFIIFIIYIILMLKYFIKDNKNISKFIKVIIEQNFHLYNINENNLLNKDNKDNKKKNNKTNNNKVKNKDNSNEKIIIKKVKNKLRNNKVKNAPNKKKIKSLKIDQKGDKTNINKRKSFNPKILFIKDLIINKNINLGNVSNGSKTKLNSSKNKSSFKKLNKNNSQIKFTINKEKEKNKKNKLNKNNNIKKNSNNHILNTQELNSLNYKQAIKLDKRSYFQYYFSLLLKKHLILFSFIPTKDFNIVSLKICLFLIIFSLYFAVNGFFFNDKSMHNIYIDNGSFNIVEQIPKILYSSAISIAIQQILRLLALSESELLQLKKEKKLYTTINKSKELKKNLKIKFLIFFILGFCLMSFFLYFIACFCAVYNNTQIILIEDTLLTFGVSMLYPFIINLIPGCFRIYALKAKNKDKEFIYKLSLILALL